ncbi:hypothetical protein ACJJI3_02765 [Microbulbifer sp. ZKSA004]|uniref:hypothetical protein n=1 Tax=Microbulbifer sp. ZKSA004 TaxID=3243389 RepID=UPI00403A19EF
MPETQINRGDRHHLASQEIITTLNAPLVPVAAVESLNAVYFFHSPLLVTARFLPDKTSQKMQ